VSKSHFKETVRPDLAFVTIGRSVRFTREELDRWLARLDPSGEVPLHGRRRAPLIPRSLGPTTPNNPAAPSRLLRLGGVSRLVPFDHSIRACRDPRSPRATPEAIVVSQDLDKAVSLHLADLEKDVTPEWAKIVEGYFKSCLIPFFGDFSRFTHNSYLDYGRARLTKVSRPSVRHELSALRRFVAWCGEHGMSLPPVPSLPKHGPAGTRAKNARKRKATIVTESQAKRILMAMPEKSRRTGEWIRPLFVVLWETGLRPTSVLKLEAGLHFKKGSSRLFVTREIDKESFERHIPLSAEARKALDRVCPKEGKLFKNAKGSLRVYMENALKAAGLTDRNISPYDFRHSRITHGANSGAPLAGVSYIAGHKYISTTAGYVQTSEAAAREVIRARAKKR
jgi:integrase